MIQVYNRDNTDYTKNGDCVLFPEMAEVHVVLNGAWEGKLEHPLDKEGRWKYLTEEAVVKMPSFNGDQLFRIRKPYKTDVGVTCTMEPIFYDCRNDTFLVDVRPERKNGQEALNILCTGKYRGLSDILTQSTAYYEYKNLLEALVGDQDNSFLNRWGGEVIFDNYTISINSRAGGDYNVEIRYGKNLPEDGMSVELDMAKVTTRIYPKAYNGYTMSNHGYVDSPLINNYALIYANTITFSDVKMREDAQEDDELNGIIVCDSQAELDAALRAKCLEEFDAGADKPEVTIEADLILLQNTEQYADIADLESVSLGDTIHCYNNHLGITTNARVVELTYNSLEKRVENVTLGSFQESYFDTLTKGLRGIDELAQRANSALGGDGSIIAEKIKGVLNGSMAMIRTQYNIAERQDVMAILFENLDPTSDTYGAIGIGTQGIMISKTRNQAGTDWVWTTAATALGIVADTIVTGLLSDASGNNYWNLDTGEFRLASTTKVGSGTKTLNDIATGSELTQQQVFNKLTNNGTVQGIYLQNGKLYIAGEFMEIGKISSQNGLVYFDLDNDELVCSSMKNSNTEASGNLTLEIERGQYGTGYYSYLELYNNKYTTVPFCIKPSESGYPTYISCEEGLRFHSGSVNKYGPNNSFTGGEIHIEDDSVWIKCGTTTGSKFGAITVSQNGVQVEPILSTRNFSMNGTFTYKGQEWNPFSTSSDRRLKKDIDGVENDFLEAVGRVEIVQFRWKDREDTRYAIGIIAQDVVKNCKDAGTDYREYGIVEGGNDEDGNNYYSVKYTEFLLARIAYDEQKIAAQQTEIDDLKARVERLEKMLEERMEI